MIPIDNAARIEDLTWIADTGGDAESAARRVGLTLNALERWCRREGQTELYARLRHNGHHCDHRCEQVRRVDA